MAFISIDFDSTIIIDDQHIIIKEVPHALNVIRELISNGHKIILETMRSGIDLNEAVMWLHEHNIELFAVNENPTQKQWSNSSKIYADAYIDDLDIGCPLIYDENYMNPYVDWIEVREILKKKGFL